MTKPKIKYSEDFTETKVQSLLSARGFTETQIKWWVEQASVYYLSHDQVADRFGTKADGLVIPYFNLDGEPLLDNGRPFERIRFDSGLNGSVVKFRYSQESGTQLHAYLPPLQMETWRDVLADPTREIAITEGEFKAGQATQVGIPTVGLGGVDCLVTRNGLVPELKGMKLEGRVVFIIFDAPLHKQLQQSIKRAATWLVTRGATVKVCNIAATDTYKLCREQSAAWRVDAEKWREELAANGYQTDKVSPMPVSPSPFEVKEDGKMGLDDYLLAGGAYHALREEAKPLSEAFSDFAGGAEDADNPLLTEIAVVTGYPGVFFLHLTGQEAGITRNRESMAVVQAPVKVIRSSADNKKTTVKPAFNDWLESPWRVTIGVIVTRPDLPPLTITPEGDWNSWAGIETVPRKNQFYADFFYAFVREFFTSEVEGPEVSELHRREFLRWAAHLFQKPGVRHYTSWTFTSDQEGIGKSALAELLAYIIGVNGRNENGDGAGAAIAGASTFEGDYVDLWPGKMLVALNEPSSDNAKMRQRMKNCRTDPFLEVNNKYGSKFRIRNVVNFIFTTNEPYAFGIKEEARRDWVWEPDKRQGTPWVEEAGKFAALATGWDQKAKDFRSAVLWELLYEISLEGFSPFDHAGSSKAKLAAAAASRSRVGTGIRENLEDILLILEDKNIPAIAWTQTTWEMFTGDKDRDKQTTTKGALKRELEKLGYGVERPLMTVDKIRTKVWAVTQKGQLWSDLSVAEKEAAIKLGGESCGVGTGL